MKYTALLLSLLGTASSISNAMESEHKSDSFSDNQTVNISQNITREGMLQKELVEAMTNPHNIAWLEEAASDSISEKSIVNLFRAGIRKGKLKKEPDGSWVSIVSVSDSDSLL